MTPQDRAIELLEKLIPHVYNEYDGDDSKHYNAKRHAIECALIAVDQTIETLNMDIRDLDVRGSILIDLIKYWRQVREEIEKL